MPRRVRAARHFDSGYTAGLDRPYAMTNVTLLTRARQAAAPFDFRKNSSNDGRCAKSGWATAGPPDTPREPGREEGVATKVRKKTARPERFKVILFNDDYTPMEFVVTVLENVFGKTPSAAMQIMLQIHRSGLGVAGVFVLEVAETKAMTVHRLAEQGGHPLRAGVEKE